MATKTSGSNWEEAERLGPYKLHEQVPQSGHERGLLFRATHETTGATALVFKPSEEEARSAPLSDWQARCISSTSPRYLSMEVEQSPWSFAAHTHSVEELLFMSEGLRDGVRRMTHHLPRSNEPRAPRRLGLALAGAAAVCALIFALAPRALVPLPPDSAAPMASAVSTDTTEPPLVSSLTDTAPGWPLGLAHPFPRQPYKGQKRPPCTPRVEVEIQGGCWVPHKLKAPCPEELHEYQGECYTAAYSAQPTPRAVGK
jgi:hypothetical protein